MKWYAQQAVHAPTRKRLAILCGVVVALGCRETDAPPPAQVEAGYVVGAAAAALGPDGRFVLPDSIVNPPGELTEEQARRVMQEYAKAFARSLAMILSRDHRATVDPLALHPCDRAIYAASPVLSLTPAPSEWGQRVWAAHWVVPMCEKGSGAVAMFSVSARATELIPALDSKELVPWDHADINAYGIPSAAETPILTPEAAVERSFQATGKRISSVPIVVMTPLPYAPVLVRWRTVLEAPVRMRGQTTGVPRELGDLLVGFVGSSLESGAVDRSGQAASERVWHDSGGKAIRVVLSPLAAVDVERVQREEP